MRLPLLMAMMLASACSAPPAAKPADPDGAQSAVVRLLPVEGGCWILETAQGRVQPLDLAAEFRRDGQRVQVVLEDLRDVMTTCQAGPLKRIVTIKPE